MTVKELIIELELVENKDLPVFVFSNSFYDEIRAVSAVDISISDRVDIEVNEE